MDAKWFRQRREKLELTQLEVATAANVTTSTVANWEAGRCPPESHRWPVLASIYKCQIKDIALAAAEIVEAPAA